MRSGFKSPYNLNLHKEFFVCWLFSIVWCCGFAINALSKKSHVYSYYNFKSEGKCVLCGIVVKISGFHPCGRGSNPRTNLNLRKEFFVCWLFAIVLRFGSAIKALYSVNAWSQFNSLKCLYSFLRSLSLLTFDSVCK